MEQGVIRGHSDRDSSWSDHFQDVRARQPGPEPGCRAPPPEGLPTIVSIIRRLTDLL